MTDEGWRARAVSADAAVSAIQAGDRVFVGSACATPLTLLGALEGLDRPPGGVHLVSFLTSGLGDALGGGGGARSRYVHRVLFVGSDERTLTERGARVEYVPTSLADVPVLLETGRWPIDVALLQVSPPDADGWCSLGVSVDVTLAAARAATTVLAEINPAMPRTRGSGVVHVDRLDAVVAVDTPVTEYVHEPVGAVGERIAQYVARLVPDGATLQIGLGRIPDAMLRHLVNRRDLGIHSDVITDAVADLVEAGALTGTAKTLHPGEVVTSMAVGTRRLYDLVDDDARMRFEPIEYVADPQVIARNDHMVSVTQAFAIDLSGQVCADSFEGQLYGGVATQPDFHRGAAASRGGKAIVCLASTAADGSSRIRLRLRDDEAVAVSRADVRFVVTEYGTAYLHGASLRERAIALVEIAHPDHRDALLGEARDAGVLPTKQRLRSRREYPVEEERRLVLADGAEVILRPTRTSDARLLQDLFYRLRPEDVYTRFFTNLASLPDPMAEHLCSVDYRREMAFVAVVGEWEDERAVATSSYYLDESTNLADVAYLVDPGWQGRGLGRALQERTAEYARSRGVRGFTADVLASNVAMLRVFEASGCTVDARLDGGEYEITMWFADADRDAAGTGAPADSSRPAATASPVEEEPPAARRGRWWSRR